MVAASGLGAEDGAALKKKFKRAVVTGGTYCGARYSDLADADVRKAAKGYRGDPRFLQYCKQFVSLELVDDEPTQQNGAGSRFEKSSDGHVMQQRFLRPFVFVWSCLKSFFGGRWLSMAGFLFFLMVVISRPAFGRLLGRLVGISFRLIFRRLAGLMFTVIDSILDEAATQVGEALLPVSYENLPKPDVPIQVIQERFTLTHFLINAFCILLGSLLQRNWVRSGPAVRPPG